MTMKILTKVLPHARFGVPYSSKIAVEGGVSPYTFTPNLELGIFQQIDGLTFYSDGTLTGTPILRDNNLRGNILKYELLFTLKDSQGATNLDIASTFDGQGMVELNIVPAIDLHVNRNDDNEAQFPAAKVGTAYIHVLLGQWGVLPYSFVLHDGDLPSGISIGREPGESSSNGVYPLPALVGTPTKAGTYHFVLTLTDANDEAGSVPCSIFVAA